MANQRLRKLIPLVAHLGEGISKGQQPLPAVGLHPRIGKAHRQPRYAHQAQVLPSGPGQQHHQHGHDHDAPGSGQIGLLQNQQKHRRRNRQQGQDARPQALHLLEPEAERGGQIQHRGDFGQLRRLKAQARNAFSQRPGAVHIHADPGDQHQHQQREAAGQGQHDHARASARSE